MASRSLSRRAAALLAVGALVVVPGLTGLTGGLVPVPLVPMAIVASVLLFPAGWVALGISALRADRAGASWKGRSRDPIVAGRPCGGASYRRAGLVGYGRSRGRDRGAVHAFATGAGLDIVGRAQMVRTADGTTIVTLHVAGLVPDTSYGAHVHQLACGTGDADGHYRFDPAGPAAPPNEIWPGFVADAAGIGNGNAMVQGTAGPTAVSVVIHAPGGAKIACADLR